MLSNFVLNRSGCFGQVTAQRDTKLLHISKIGLALGMAKRGVTERGGIRICLPVHCLSAPPDRQCYCHINAASLSLLKHDQIARDNRLPVQCRRLPVVATSYCYPGCHANVVTPCLLTRYLSLPNGCPNLHCPPSLLGEDGGLDGRNHAIVVAASLARVCFRDAKMTIKIIFERSSQKGGRQGVRKGGQQGNHLGILLSA